MGFVWQTYMCFLPHDEYWSLTNAQANGSTEEEMEYEAKFKETKLLGPGIFFIFHLCVSFLRVEVPGEEAPARRGRTKAASATHSPPK